MAVTAGSSSLVAVLLLSRFAAAATNNSYGACQDSHWDNGFNASGSVSVPGPKPNNSYPDTTWTWSRYVVDDNDLASNTSDVWQSLGLKISPLLNLSDPSTPYTGCVIAVSGLNSSLVTDTSKDDGTCSSVFTADCLAEIKYTIYNGASAYSGTPAGSVEHLDCNSLLGAVSLNRTSKCDPHLFTGYTGSQFLPNNFTGYPNPVCPIVNPGDSNVTIGHRAFFSWGDIEETRPDNYTIYDKTVVDHVPVFVATWLKDASNGTSSTLSSGEGNWADTQIMCIPANDTQPGSRNFTEAQKTQTGSVGKINCMGMRIFGAIGLTVLLGMAL